METKTTRYLRGAERNQRFAESALADLDMLPALREWAAVAAFYSAVHYVNAYLYEQRRYEPQNHSQRRVAIVTTPELFVFLRDYRQLNDDGYHARYTPMYTVTDSQLQQLVAVHLRRIRDSITSLLEPTDPE